MDYYHRSLESSWNQASRQFPVLLLTGPRQVGKTTLLREICEPGRNYVTLDDIALRALANEDPALFLKQHPPPVLIDEVQYAPDLLPYIKMEVDRSRTAGAFWLTGSQQFQMMKGITESLAGRVGIVNLLGFSRRERARDSGALAPFVPTDAVLDERSTRQLPSELADLYREIWLGAFPALVAGPVEDRDLFYSSYLQTYLQRDVRDLTQVGSQETFLRFLRACAARTSQLLNLSDLARDVDVSVATAKSWLSVLVASMQVHLLRPFHSNVTKRLVKTPKLYFLDTGLAAYLTEWTTPEALASGAMAGPIFETLVVTEILKSWWHCMKSPALYYYRTRDKREVDLVFVQDQQLYPVEIKRAATPRAEWARGFASLDRFTEIRGRGAVVCLCPGPVPLDDKTTALPLGYL